MNLSRTIFDYRTERLVISGLRNSMAGYDLGDPECWNHLWDMFTAEVGADDTRKLMGDLQYWVRGVRSAVNRQVEYYPSGCNVVCRDECLLLSLLAACQHKDVACIDFALHHLGAGAYEHAREILLSSSQIFARALRNSGHMLLEVPLNVLQSVTSPSESAANASVIMH